MIAELVTGTFYLLVLGLGAFAGAVVAWTRRGNEVVQAIVGGSWRSWARGWCTTGTRATAAATPRGSNLLDRGQPVVLEGWADESARHRAREVPRRVVGRAPREPRPSVRRRARTLYIESAGRQHARGRDRAARA